MTLVNSILWTYLTIGIVFGIIVLTISYDIPWTPYNCLLRSIMLVFIILFWPILIVVYFFDSL